MGSEELFTTIEVTRMMETIEVTVKDILTQ